MSNLMALTELMTPWHLNMLMNECEVKEDREVSQGHCTYEYSNLIVMVCVVCVQEFIHFTFHAYSELISLHHLYPTDWTALRLLHNK